MPDNKDEIARELIAGATPYNLTKVYPRTTVYRIYNELKESGQLSGNIISPPSIDVPNEPLEPTKTTTRTVSKARTTSTSTGAIVHEMPETIMPGSKMFPVDALNAVRGVMEIRNRPKVLNMPTPELLYPSMVISIQEWGWPPLMPQDFIDAALDVLLKAADIEYNVYTRRSQMQDILKYAEKGGYKPPSNGNGNKQQVVPANINSVTEENGHDSTTGVAESGSEQDRNGGEPGKSIQDQAGGNTGGEGGDSGPPI